MASPNSNRRGTAVARRNFLRGAGGVVIGLPFLPSLLERDALAQTAQRQPRFVAMTTNHGGIREASMYPAETALSNTGTVLGYSARWGTLPRSVQGTDAVVSSVLRAPGDKLTARLVGKMNVIRGLDIPFYIAHNTGGHLGNYARNDGNGGDGQMVQKFPMPTIDQVMAYAPSFYRDLTGIRTRAVITGDRNGLSWNYSNPTAKSGVIQAVQSVGSTKQLFMELFVPSGMPMQAVQRKPIVDRVLANYQTLRQSNRRLSADDQQRLDDHMDRLADLQRRVMAMPPAMTSASCKDLKAPTLDAADMNPNRNPVGARQKYALYNDVVVAGFMCGTTRIAVIGTNEESFAAIGAGGSWHQDYAHKWDTDPAQPGLVEANRNMFGGSFLDLAAKLDVEEANGFTYLDNTLMAWSQECGQETHDNRSMPLVTAGGAAGFLKTGLYLDYRNRAKNVSAYGQPKGPPGLTWNRWLATALQAMGLPKAEWEKAGTPGYGVNFVAPEYSTAYVSGVVDSASDVLPFLKA